MSTVAYRCPCCGAPLAYGAESGKLECAACGNSYELDALEVMNESQETGSIQFDMPTETFNESEAAQMRAYICQGCGAELMTEETTTATECPYCGSPTVLPERIDNAVKPEMVIPFTVTKEQAARQQHPFADLKGRFRNHASVAVSFLRSHPKAALLMVADGFLTLPSYLTLMFLQQRLSEQGVATMWLGFPVMCIAAARMCGTAIGKRLHPKSLSRL